MLARREGVAARRGDSIGVRSLENDGNMSAVTHVAAARVAVAQVVASKRLGKEGKAPGRLCACLVGTTSMGLGVEYVAKAGFEREVHRTDERQRPTVSVDSTAPKGQPRLPFSRRLGGVVARGGGRVLYYYCNKCCVGGYRYRAICVFHEKVGMKSLRMFAFFMKHLWGSTKNSGDENETGGAKKRNEKRAFALTYVSCLTSKS